MRQDIGISHIEIRLELLMIIQIIETINIK